MTQTYSFAKCISTKQWYKCPLAAVVFAFFILLFAYSIYMMVSNFKMIQYYTDKTRSGDEENTHKLKEFEVLFIVNIVSAFISFAVIVAFLGKALANVTFLKFFNKFLILIIIIFLMVIASWNIHVYSGEKGNVNKGVQITNWVIIGLSSAIVLISVIFYFYDLNLSSTSQQSVRKARHKDHQGTNLPDHF